MFGPGDRTKDFDPLKDADHGMGIDWAAAAPSWPALLVGLAFPAVAFVAVSCFLDVLICTLLRPWVGQLTTAGFWMIQAAIFPLACAGIIGLIVVLQAMHNLTVPPKPIKQDDKLFQL
jgi:hypothetical protein